MCLFMLDRTSVGPIQTDGEDGRGGGTDDNSSCGYLLAHEGQGFAGRREAGVTDTPPRYPGIAEDARIRAVAVHHHELEPTPALPRAPQRHERNQTAVPGDRRSGEGTRATAEGASSQKVHPSPVDRGDSNSSHRVFLISRRIEGADDPLSIWCELGSRRISAAPDSECVAGNLDPVKPRTVRAHDEDRAVPLGHEYAPAIWRERDRVDWLVCPCSARAVKRPDHARLSVAVPDPDPIRPNNNTGRLVPGP